MKSLSIVGFVLSLCCCTLDPQKAQQKYIDGGRKFMQKGQYSAAIAQFRTAVDQGRSADALVDALHLLAQAYLANRQPHEAYAALKRAVDLDPNRVNVRTTLATFLLGVHDFKQAEEHARAAIAGDPNAGAAWQALGVALASLKDIEGARKALEEAVKLSPKDPSALTNLGAFLARAGSLAEAEQKLRAATDVDPRHLPSWRALAHFYQRQERSADAEKVMQTAVHRNPDELSIYLASADLLFAQGKTQALEAQLATLRGRLRKPETALALGDFFMARNQRERALAEFLWGLEVAPKDPQIKARLVEYYLNAGKVDEAERWNSEILAGQPTDVQAGIARGRILFARGKRDEAIAELRQQVSQNRDSAQAHFHLADAYAKTGSDLAAKAEYMDAARIAPGFLPARLGLGNVMIRERDFAGARQHLLAARERAPNDRAVLVALALTYSSEGKWLEAESEIESALKLDPLYSDALSQLAAIGVAAGQPARSVARLRKHIAAHPDNAHGHLVLGSLYRHLRDFKNAETELDRSVQLAPNSLSGRMQLALLYRDQRRYDAAVKQYEVALKLEPRSSNLHVFLGMVLYLKGEREAARTRFEQALALDPNSGLAANNLAAANAELGRNLDEALGLAQKARQLAPDLVEAADTLGWIQYKKGLHQTALPLLEECVKKAPGSAIFQYHLGMVLIAAGQRETARTHLESALRLKLPDEEAARAREGLAKIR